MCKWILAGVKTRKTLKAQRSLVRVVQFIYIYIRVS